MNRDQNLNQNNPNGITLNDKQYHIICHSLGMTDKSKIPLDFYRNRYVAGDSSREIDNLNYLHKIGLLTKSEPIIIYDNDRMWTVTEKGIEVFRNHFYFRNNN